MTTHFGELVQELIASKKAHLPIRGFTISSLPNNFRFLKNQITSLEIGESSIDDGVLSLLLEGLPKLKSLRITSKFLRPTSIFTISSNLSDLTNLKLDDCSLGDNDIIRIVKNLKTLKYLDLNKNSITEDGVRVITETQKNLISLNLSQNRIGDLGAFLIAEHLHRLNSLSLVATGITKVGIEAIAKSLSNLRELNLWHNVIGDLGAISIANNLHNLTKLDVWDCDISDEGGCAIAEHLTNLTYLEIGANHLTQKTTSLIAKNLKRLTFLNVSHSLLADEGLLEITTNLGKLTFLGLANCNITDTGIENLYKTYRHKKKFRARIFDNLLTNLPGAAQNDWNRLKEYYDSIQKRYETVEVNALNILLLGNTTAGKSSLLEYYAYNTFTEKRKSTFGIVHETITRKLGRKRVELSFWDFGGQEYFHGTHRLFLGMRNSLYLILWQSDFEKDELMKNENGDDCFPYRYWLGTVQHFSNSLISNNEIYTKTLLIQSKEDIDGMPFPVLDEFTKLNGRFALPSKNIYTTSVKSSAKNEPRYSLLWQLLKLRLDELITEHKATYRINRYILEIKETALPEWRKERHLYLTKNNFIERCIKIYEDFENSENFILDYLESCGEILRFDVDQLQDKIFINPQSLLQKIYAVLNSKVQKKEGRFSKKDIKNIPLDERDIVIEIMLQMELIFENPQIDGEYVAPQYMREDSMTVLLQHLRQLLNPLFTLRFPDFMPRAYITQFISRHGGKSEDGVFWKFGVLYQHKENDNVIRVLVEADPESRFLRVYTEDNKLKYNAAQNVFNFFAFHEKRKQTQQINDEKTISDLDNYTPINHLELSSDGMSFSTIQEILIAIENKTAKVKSTKGNYIPVESIFHVLLNKKAIMPKRVFFSYAHADKKYRDEFEKHFASLKREGIIESWNDSMIPLGGDWDATIKQHLNDADVVLYMLSPSFMQSDYIWQNEVKKLVEDKGEGIFIPIFISPCDFEHAIIGEKQGAPTKAEGGLDWIALHENPARRDELYLQITKKIRALINSK